MYNVAKAALDGTMRHALFEATMKTKDFTNEAAIAHIKSIVRENAESLLACNISSREAEKEIIKFLPQLRRFANEYTEFGSGAESKDAYLESHGSAKSSHFVAKSVEAVEEPVISPELVLKGNVDMLVKAISSTSNQIQQSPSLMGIELKTGHHQNAQNIHVAQLALYVIMLQTRYGVNDLSNDKNTTCAMNSGVLLYMNNDSIRAIHIAPIISEIKSLIGMRNLVAIETIHAQRPRGVRLSYEENTAEPSHVTVK
jgi:CRISPR/Cas system-associated exonuclease Cas4 (RecB family)